MQNRTLADTERMTGALITTVTHHARACATWLTEHWAELFDVSNFDDTKIYSFTEKGKKVGMLVPVLLYVDATCRRLNTPSKPADVKNIVLSLQENALLQNVSWCRN